MAYLSLAPVSAAVYGKLNVSALTSLCAGVYDHIPQGTAYPMVWYEVREPQDVRGFGTSGLPEVELRVHVFSTYAGSNEAQTIAAKVIELLRDQALTVTGYNHCGRVFYDGTPDLGMQDINGVIVRELVPLFRIYVEEA